MDGRPVFKWAIRTLKETIGEVLDASGMALGDVDLVVFHQANMRIINAAVDVIGMPPARSSTISTATATLLPPASPWPWTRPIARAASAAAITCFSAASAPG